MPRSSVVPSHVDAGMAAPGMVVTGMLMRETVLCDRFSHSIADWPLRNRSARREAVRANSFTHRGDAADEPARCGWG